MAATLLALFVGVSLVPATFGTLVGKPFMGIMMSVFTFMYLGFETQNQLILGFSVIFLVSFAIKLAMNDVAPSLVGGGSGE